ncbi:MAG: RecX family transcriptional regulator [Chloroflexi bacterium]|nr:RecX family transcriptional regulator [Chloroflexota bacterium]
MSKITALRTNKRTDKRVSLFLDGKFAISLDAEAAVKEGLKIGQELSDNQLEVLVRNTGLGSCLNVAYRYLSYRPRSEAEMRERLQHRNFEDSQIEIVINKLKEQNLLDDTAFAQFWKENRESFRPISQRLTRLELRKKGVADEIINEVVSQTDDKDSAYRAALSKAKRLSHQEYETFRRRLSDYLKRRGFDYSVINQTIKRVWQELAEQSL